MFFKYETTKIKLAKKHLKNGSLSKNTFVQCNIFSNADVT